MTRFIGSLLMAVGALMVLLCGGCTLVIMAIGVAGAVSTPTPAGLRSVSGLFSLALVLGGVPAAGGGVLFWAGLRIARPPKPKPATVAKTFE